jgi:hypothetical protein
LRITLLTGSGMAPKGRHCKDDYDAAPFLLLPVQAILLPGIRDGSKLLEGRHHRVEGG